MDSSQRRRLTRAAFAELARRAGLAAAPVRSVSEVAESAQTAERRLIVWASAEDGRSWPLLGLRLARTPPVVARPIGRLGEANAELTHGLDSAATPS